METNMRSNNVPITVSWCLYLLYIDIAGYCYFITVGRHRHNIIIVVIAVVIEGLIYTTVVETDIDDLYLNKMN